MRTLSSAETLQISANKEALESTILHVNALPTLSYRWKASRHDLIYLD